MIIQFRLFCTASRFVPKQHSLVTWSTLDNSFCKSVQEEDYDNFYLDSKLLSSRRVSRTNRGGRQAQYSVMLASVGTNQWCRYMYLSKGKSLYKFKALNKASNQFGKDVHCDNYIIFRSGNRLANFTLNSSFKTSSVDVQFLNGGRSIRTNPAFYDIFKGIFPLAKLSTKYQGSASKINRVKALSRAMQNFPDSYDYFRRLGRRA